jgi:hypothetical protein
LLQSFCHERPLELIVETAFAESHGLQKYHKTTPSCGRISALSLSLKPFSVSVIFSDAASKHILY